MNDRYLFRGKRIDNGEWVVGYLYITHNGEYEISSYNADFDIERMTSVVIPETVGQCTGLKDMTGKLIFEGDIIKINSRVVSSETRETLETEIGFVKYDMDECGYRIVKNNVILNEILTLDDLKTNMWVWNETQNEYQKVRYISTHDLKDYHWCDGWGNNIEDDELWRYKKESVENE